MRYRKPVYYDQFSCAAGSCPDTCCAGWQIAIDEESLETYHHMKGDFARQLKNSIDWMDECFYQEQGRCAMLNEANLCEIYRNAGEEYLCDTCREYPRHVEEFEEVRELSLSLSCPVAARMLFDHESIFPLVIWETEETDEFEEFDKDLFRQLELDRKIIFQILQDRNVPIKNRFEKLTQRFAAEHTWDDSYENRLRELRFLRKLPLQRRDWKEILEKAERMLYNNGKDAYAKLCCEFETQWGTKWEMAAEKLAVYFIYTYYLGAVYDEMPDLKVAFAVFSVSWIKELCMAIWAEDPKHFTSEDMVRAAWCYAREMEHDDDNLLTLEEYL